MSQKFSVSKQNSLCFPCLEKVRTKFPVLPVPWPPWEGGGVFREERQFIFWPIPHPTPQQNMNMKKAPYPTSLFANVLEHLIKSVLGFFL